MEFPVQFHTPATNVFRGMETLTAPGTNAGDHAELQERVNAYFHGAASYWRDVYEERSFDGMVYRLRQSAALEMIHRLSGDHTGPVLEVGCGSGSLTVALAAQGLRMTSIDPVATMVDATLSRLQSARLESNAQVNRGNVYDLPYRDDEFQGAIALGVVPWLRDPQRALRELARVVMPGGFLIVSSDNSHRLSHFLDPRFSSACSLLRRLKNNLFEIRGKTRRVDQGIRVRMYSPGEFRSMLRAAGFIPREERTLGFGPIAFRGTAVLPERIGLALHNALQYCADVRVPGIRQWGSHHLVRAQRGVVHEHSGVQTTKEGT